MRAAVNSLSWNPHQIPIMASDQIRPGLLSFISLTNLAIHPLDIAIRGRMDRSISDISTYKHAPRSCTSCCYHGDHQTCHGIECQCCFGIKKCVPVGHTFMFTQGVHFGNIEFEVLLKFIHQADSLASAIPTSILTNIMYGWGLPVLWCDWNHSTSRLVPISTNSTAKNTWYESIRMYFVPAPWKTWR